MREPPLLRWMALASLVFSMGCGEPPTATTVGLDGGEAIDPELDGRLRFELAARSFTGRIEATIEAKLGRPIHPERAELGRLLFFDPILSITRDNSCSGCHGPNVAFNDSKSIAVGVGNNGIVGPNRRGPHNQRRAPTVINAALYQALMWDSRFRSISFDPFDNSLGFSFPAPEASSLSHMQHLLGAQAFTPVVSRVEMAGPDFAGDNAAIRAELVSRIRAIDEYGRLFAEAFEDVGAGNPIEFEHIGAAIAEFEFTLVFADAPLDQFARGEPNSMTNDQKRGAMLFFDKAMCAECHLVRGFGAETFSDFEPHNMAVPQIVPTHTNVVFDGPGQDEDYGLEQQTGDPRDRYKFRTSPLRNVAYQPTFMHNGAYTCLDQAIRHHTSFYATVANFSTESLDEGLQARLGPSAEMNDRVHHLLSDPPELSETQFQQILDFVKFSLTDPDAHPSRLMHLVPTSVPSGLDVHRFEAVVERPECAI